MVPNYNFKNLFGLVIIFIICEPLCAQDTIFVNNKKKIISKIVEITKRDVRYKKFSSPEGKTYLIDKRDLIKIVYANGVVDTFNVKLMKIVVKPTPVPRIKKFDPRATEYFRNFVFINFTDLVSGIATIGFERTFKTGRTSLLVPFSFGVISKIRSGSKYDNSSSLNSIVPTGAYYFPNKIFSTGLELNHFPVGQGTLKYYLGPVLEFGWFRFYKYKGSSFYPGSFTIEKNSSSFVTLMFKNGVLFQITKKFNLSTFLAMGFANFGLNPNSTTDNANYYYSNTSLRYFTFEFGISAGYKF